MHSACASHWTRSWSRLDSKLISHLTFTMHPEPGLHPFCFYFWHWQIRTLFTPSLLPTLVVAASHESPGRAPVWLAGLPDSVSIPIAPFVSPLATCQIRTDKTGTAQLFPRGLPIPIAWPSMAYVINGTLDCGFGLKMASNLRCSGMTFKHVMCSICWHSLVTISAVVVAPIAWQADRHTYIWGLCLQI